MTNPHLLPALATLTSMQWRCLRVVSEVADVAHAARKLHCSQALLRDALETLQACVGAQHLALVGQGVQLSPALHDLLRRHPLCGAEKPCLPPPPKKALPGAPDVP